MSLNMDYSTVNQFIKKYPAFTNGGMRHLLFHSNSNGLDASGAIKRIGRKILIDVEKFFQWIEAQNGDSGSKGAVYGKR